MNQEVTVWILVDISRDKDAVCVILLPIQILLY